MKTFFENKINILLVIILSVSLVGIGYLGYRYFFVKEDTIIVPDFKDKSVDEVISWCNDNGLTDACVITYENDDEIDKDNVVYQSIKADEKFVDKISFVISKGKVEKKEDETIEVIKLEDDTTKENVEKWVKDNELTNVEYIQEKTDDYDKGVVFKIEPITIKSKDDEIKVFISLGKKDDVDEEDDDTDYIIVKENAYVGLSLDEFKTKVKALILSVGDHVSEWDEFSSEIEEGKIIWHGSGEHYVVNEGVRYSLSLGEGIVLDEEKYLGLTEDEFKAAMEKIGLKAVTDGDNDKYSDYDAGLIRWYKSNITYKKGDIVYYSISKGKKTVVTVDETKYLGLSEADFIAKMKELGLVPYNDGDNAKLSDYEKGCVRWYKTGKTYYLGDQINYSVSAGKYEYYDIDADTYEGDSVDDFIAYMTRKGLYAGNKTSEYSNTISKGRIIRVKAGTYKTGDSVDYVVSLGPEPDEPTTDTQKLDKPNTYNTLYNVSSASEMESALRNGALKGFTNVTYQYVTNHDYSVGKIVSIEVNGSSSYSKGDYPIDTRITVYICNSN